MNHGHRVTPAVNLARRVFRLEAVEQDVLIATRYGEIDEAWERLPVLVHDGDRQRLPVVDPAGDYGGREISDSSVSTPRT